MGEALGGGGAGLDWTNGNTLAASVLVETLVRLGVRWGAVCPGSRSTPLTIALARHPSLEAVPILDERSAAFWALGRSRRSRRPAVVVCTSGTAAANFLPAVVEASEQGVPLLVLTADRPPELRACGAGQAIDQVKLFGSFVVGQMELGLPEPTIAYLSYLRQTVLRAWTRAIAGAGPVHLNIPLRDPLPPLPDPAIAQPLATLRESFNEASFFNHLTPEVGAIAATEFPAIPWEQWRSRRGLIVAGATGPVDPLAYADGAMAIAAALGWPILADVLSPLRHGGDRTAGSIATYDAILRNCDRADALRPEVVLQLGQLPTSKILRDWLAEFAPPRWIVEPRDRNLDPLHGPSLPLTLNLETLAATVPPDLAPAPAAIALRDAWIRADVAMAAAIAAPFQARPETAIPLESQIPWILAQALPPNTPVFFNNSMPVRDGEWFWPTGDRAAMPLCNRGANGIDGVLSTAIGVAWDDQPTVLITGDLGLLHDTNGLLIAKRLHQLQRGSLTIILINNNGGGIFEMLPIAQFDPPFEDYFATPQSINFEQLSKTYDLPWELIVSADHLRDRVRTLPPHGVRILEVRRDRKEDSQWRKQLFNSLAQSEST